MTDDEKAELADVYEKAAEYLEEYGWRQNSGGVHGGPRCLVGAIDSSLLVITRYPLFSRACNFVATALEVDCEMDWNDDPSRTKDEVINVLHGLANKLR